MRKEVEPKGSDMNREQSKGYSWCIGEPIPVTIHFKDGSSKTGTVSELDTSQKKGMVYQPEGLFLSGAVYGDENIHRVVTEEGEDVTNSIRMSFGPGL